MSYCSHCGGKVNEGSKFCSACGKSNVLHRSTEKNLADIENDKQNTRNESKKEEVKNVLKTSDFSRRLGAYLIDMTLASFVGGVIFSLIFGSRFFYGDFGTLTSRLVAILSLVIYSFIFLGIFSSSPGKAIYGLVVTDIGTGKKITWKQSLVRSLGYIGSSILFGYGFWKAAFNKDRRTWHDELAKTIVMQKNTNWIVLGIILTIASVITLGYSYSSDASTQVSSSWQQFNSTEGKFKIDFPNYPTTDASKTNISGIDVNYIQYSSTIKDGSVYLAQYNEYPSQFDMKDARRALNDAVNGTATSDKDNKLVSSNFSSYGDYPAIDCSINNLREKAFMKYRYILVGQKLYAIGVISYSESLPDYGKFVNSFQLF